MAVSPENGRGKISVYYGPMFSEKTLRLTEAYGEGVGAAVFRPKIDNRYGGGPWIHSLAGAKVPAVEIEHLNPIEIYQAIQQMEGIRRVIIDEASFFPTQPFLEVVEKLASEEREVVVGGLAYDAERQPWGPILELIKKPGVESYALAARCDGDGGKCREFAIWSYAKAKKKTRLEVGGVDKYGASCEKHYLELHVPGADGG